jgi:PPOX class probable FMN-dependent enzyme
MQDHLSFNQDFLITSEADLRALFPPTHAIALEKCQDHLDTHSRALIARAPFLCIGTQSAEGEADISPRGDPRGFVKVIDDKTLLIPDRPGNNRLDTQANILSNPAVGLIFIIPGFDDTLRINGTAQLTTDPALLEKLEVKERRPTLAIVVTVTEVFMHCAKAFRRAQLWDPDRLQDRKEMPSLLQIVLDQTTGAPESPEEMDQIDADLEAEYARTMY